MEQWVHHRLQSRLHHRLCDPIRHSRYAQLSFPTIGLRYFHRPHGRRKVTARRHPIPDLIEIPFQVSLKLCHRLLIDPGRSIDEIVGQEHLLGPGRVLRAAIETGELHSMILWGPPGSGKTTLASLMATVTGARFVAFSAVLSGVKEIREVIAEAERERARRGTRTILFVDEIHRFNRAQQDAFLPHVEKGTVVLVGATTENPSFEVNSALLSRCRVYVLRALEDDDLLAIMQRALADGQRGLAPLRAEARTGRPAAEMVK